MFKHIAVLILTSTLTVASTTTPAQSGMARIDSSSVESAEASYEVMMSGRSDMEEKKLAFAVLALNMEGVKSAYEVVDVPELQSFSIGRIKDKVAGMTADEIITLAARDTGIGIEQSGQ